MVVLRSEMVPDTLVRVPEMLDTPPSQNNHAFIIPSRLLKPAFLLPTIDISIKFSSAM